MTKKKPKRGLYWHVHHEVLFEYCYDAEERREYIRTDKPESEHALRLRLMKPIRGKLGDAKAWAAYDKAWAAYDKARAAYAKAWAAYAKARAAYAKACAAYDKAWAAYDKARAAYAKAWAAYLATIKPGEAEALHAKECPNCPWDGYTIFPKEK